ncbi:MAG: peptidylprolyl isomerase [Butyrivibrio sp.]|nr:peptidylprolyl isomerase [Butyrivibrio sp.]
MMKRKLCKIIAIAALGLSFCLSGCANLNNTKLVLTTGFQDNELFRIEDISCTLPEFMVYLVNSQDAYVAGFGREILDVNVGDTSMEDGIKENCLATIAQVKAMNLLAVQNGIELTESERAQAQAAAEEYYSSLNEDEIKAMKNITQSQIATLYEEYATANKLYEYIIRDINPEISDDEARTITVEQIVLNTWKLDSMGEKVSVSESEKNSIYATAKQIKQQLMDGVDFDVLIEQYNEADEGTVSFGKGEVDEKIEEVAFNLDTGEVSNIIETEEAYVILKCISTFNREETEANKIRIVEERKREVFGEQYDVFVAGLSRIINTELWKSIKLDDSENVHTTSFFEVYRKYFEE